MKKMEHVSNSQGAKVNVLLATHLRTQSGKSNLVFLLRKFSKKKEKIKQLPQNMSLEKIKSKEKD
jgi:hypothetical protein